MTIIQRIILVIGGILLAAITINGIDRYGDDHPVGTMLQALAAIALFYRAARKG